MKNFSSEEIQKAVKEVKKSGNGDHLFRDPGHKRRTRHKRSSGRKHTKLPKPLRRITSRDTRTGNTISTKTTSRQQNTSRRNTSRRVTSRNRQTSMMVTTRRTTSRHQNTSRRNTSRRVTSRNRQTSMMVTTRRTTSRHQNTSRRNTSRRVTSRRVTSRRNTSRQSNTFPWAAPIPIRGRFCCTQSQRNNVRQNNRA